MNEINQDRLKLFISEEDIAKEIKKVAAKIREDYEDKNPVFLGILKGSFIFLADLVRAVNIDCEIDFLGASSYGKEKNTSGVIKITKDISFNIKDRDIIIVEDIIDTGLTIDKLITYLESFKPRSIKVCTFINKKERREKVVFATYKCFDIDEGFLVGYGLDYAHRYRNLPSVYIVD